MGTTSGAPWEQRLNDAAAHPAVMTLVQMLRLSKSLTQQTRTVGVGPPNSASFHIWHACCSKREGHLSEARPRGEIMSVSPRRSSVGRRTFLKVAGAGGGALALSAGVWLPSRSLETQAPLIPFVDPLPIPEVIRPSGLLRGEPFYNVTMQAFRQKLHRDLPPTPLRGYNGENG